MKRITIGAGTHLNAQGFPLSDLERREARRDIIEWASDKFGGVTFIDTYGAWKDDKGVLFIEPGWSVIAYAENANAGLVVAKQFAQEVKRALSQKAVFLLVEDIGAELV